MGVGGGNVKPKVYVETSVVSYLTAWPSRDVVTLGNQVATREWWREAARRCELVVSPLVIEESSVGDPEAARARLAALESVHVIGAGDDAIALGRVLVAAHAFPAEAAADARIRLPRRALSRCAGMLVTSPLSSVRQASSWRWSMSSRITDPIVEEVRRVRAELAARHGNDVAAIIRHAQALERTLDRTCVRYPARRVVPAGKEPVAIEERGYNPPPVAKVVRPSPSPRAPNEPSPGSPPMEPS